MSKSISIKVSFVNNEILVTTKKLSAYGVGENTGKAIENFLSQVSDLYDELEDTDYLGEELRKQKQWLLDNDWIIK